MQIKNLSMSFGTQEIFHNVNLTIPDQDHIGVVGVNGAGKTTLFKLIMNLEEPDSGEIIISNNRRIALLPQVITDVVPDTNIKVIDFIREGRPLKELNDKLTNLYSKLGEENVDIDDVYRKIDNLNKRLEYWEDYSAESTLLKLADGIGISDIMLNQSLKELSGGQKSKVAFAKLLYSKPEIILLDEPTNHMDIESKEYIINYLKHYKGTVLTISHDIDFLNQVTNKTLFLDKRTKELKLFDGNYEKFLKLQESYEESLERQVEKQEKEEEKLRTIINKYANASGKRKKMAQDREKKLEKLLENKIERLNPTKKVDLKMNMNREANNMPIQIKNLCFKYNKSNSEYIIKNLSFDLYKGEKFLIVGENGVGKSTLLKLIMNILTPDEGTIEIGNKVDIGYYAQELELLNKEKTIIENFDDTSLSPNKVRAILGRFLFYGDDVFKKIKVLSPGERARVALAKLSISGNNLLILDEPTNHLDPETQTIIGDVFKTFEGSMIIVSHNPDFVKNLGIERTLILPEGKIDFYKDETIEYYHELERKRIKKR